VIFTLPGTTLRLDLKAERAWTDGSGQAGVRFLDLGKTSKEQMEKWLAQRFGMA
jgi:hypothetical protein